MIAGGLFWAHINCAADSLAGTGGPQHPPLPLHLNCRAHAPVMTVFPINPTQAGRQDSADLKTTGNRPLAASPHPAGPLVRHASAALQRRAGQMPIAFPLLDERGSGS